MEFIRETRRTRELNLTPLVDIILMLVVFFMLTTSFVISESMELTLPSGKASPSMTNVLRILVTPSGQAQVEDKMLSGDALNAVLVERLSKNPDEKIAIFTTPGVSVQQLVAVLDEVYLTGGRNVQVDKIDE